MVEIKGIKRAEFEKKGALKRGVYLNLENSKATVTHKIDRAGYFMSIEVVDTFNLSPVGLVIR